MPDDHDKPIALEPFGRRLKRIRKAKGLTQVELARLLGTTQSVLSDYERGKLRLNAYLIVRLAKTLDVSTDYLLGYKATGSPRRRSIDRHFRQRLEQVSLLPLTEKKALLKTLDGYLRGVGGASGE